MAATARKPCPAAPKPGVETFDLSDLSITITKPGLFTNDEKTVTFDGERLAVALRYVALSCPNPDAFTDGEYAALETAGIAAMCDGLSNADLHVDGIDCNAVFHALYRRLNDMAHRINARNEGPGKLETVTITRKPATEVAP